MAFREKSFWVTVPVLSLGGLFYFGNVATLSSTAGQRTPPAVPVVMMDTMVIAYRLTQMIRCRVGG